MLCLWHCSLAHKNQGSLCRGPRPLPLAQTGYEVQPLPPLWQPEPLAVSCPGFPTPELKLAWRGRCPWWWTLCWWYSLHIPGSTEPVNLLPSPHPRWGWYSAAVKMPGWNQNGDPAQRARPLQRHPKPTPPSPPESPLLPTQVPPPFSVDAHKPSGGHRPAWASQPLSSSKALWNTWAKNSLQGLHPSQAPITTWEWDRVISKVILLNGNNTKPLITKGTISLRRKQSYADIVLAIDLCAYYRNFLKLITLSNTLP